MFSSHDAGVLKVLIVRVALNPSKCLCFRASEAMRCMCKEEKGFIPVAFVAISASAVANRFDVDK